AQGVYVDVKASNVDSSDSVSVKFYYPQTVDETTIVLKYYDVVTRAYQPVKSSGGTNPLKDTTNNLDGTVSGGRFTVVFDASSTPKVTQLTGTVFAMAVPTPTQVALSSSLTPSVLGEEVTFTAIVTGDAALNGGAVSFQDNGQEIGTANIQGGTAVFAT